MKKISKINDWCKKASIHYNLCIDTIKKAYYSAVINGELNRDILMTKIKKAQQNALKRKNKTVSTDYIFVPNSYVINQLMYGNIGKHRIGDYELSSDAKYSHVISDGSEELKIDRDDDDKVIFTGISPEHFMLLSAVYTATRDNIGTEATNISGDAVRNIPCRHIYNIIYPQKRWDKISEEAKTNFLKKIDSLKKLNKFSGRYYRHGMRSAIHIEDGTILARITLKINTLDDAMVIANINPRGLIMQAEAQKRIIGIPSEMLAYGTAEGALARFYISYRICIKNQKMNKSILCKTLDFFNGEKVSRKMIKSYMQYLVNQGFISSFSFSRHSITWVVAEEKHTPIILMHDEEGKIADAPPEETEEVKAKAEKIKKINAFTSKYKAKLEGKKINTELHSTYCNNDWKQGGRLYTSAGGYQSLSSEERKSLKINGKDTVELDFSAYHPHLLYALKGIQLSSDPYAFHSNRQACKLALNITINAKNKDQALFAFQNKWEGEKIDVDALFADMEKYHTAIAEFFYSGAGCALQNIDSEIAINILMKLRGKRIIALPVHDSFIVPSQFKEQLLQVMQEEYQKYTGGFYCPIK